MWNAPHHYVNDVAHANTVQSRRACLPSTTPAHALADSSLQLVLTWECPPYAVEEEEEEEQEEEEEAGAVGEGSNKCNDWGEYWAWS